MDCLEGVASIFFLNGDDGGGGHGGGDDDNCNNRPHMVCLIVNNPFCKEIPVPWLSICK
jgi:hypothetical protein